MNQFILDHAVLGVVQTDSAAKKLMEVTASGSTDVLAPYVIEGMRRTWLTGLVMGRWCQQDIERRILPTSMPVLRILEINQMRLCRSQHDKIYAIRGPLPPEVRDILPMPDYDKPAHEVYKSFVKAFVYGTWSLDIICLSDHPDTQTGFPAWMPDWRRRSRLAHFERIKWDDRHRFWHSDTLKLRPPRFSTDLTTISVEGILIGEVRHTELEYKLIPKLKKDVQHVPDIDVLGIETLPTGYRLEKWTFEDDARSLIKTTVATYAPDSLLWENPADTLLEILHRQFHKEQQIPSDTMGKSTLCLDDTTSENISARIAEIYDSISSIARSRTVIETDSHELALTPFWTQAGDIVCQLLGALFQ